MTDEIAALVQLKDVDARIGSLTTLIELVPEQLAELTRKVELVRETPGRSGRAGRAE
jgi:hypothetical protein